MSVESAPQRLRHRTEISVLQAVSTQGGRKPGGVTRGRRVGRPHPICQPLSRTGENPPYGILGGTVETSASFEARYAPPFYPTRAIVLPDPGFGSPMTVTT